MSNAPEGAKREVAEFLAGKQGEMLELLETLVNINSPTRDKQGVDDVGAVLCKFLESAGLQIETIGQEEFGDINVARWSGQNDGRPILLMGHRDTVFPLGEATARPFCIRDGRAYGPGVADMKGGLVINAFVLAAIARFSATRCPVVGLFTPDEEIASPSARPTIERFAKDARAVFNSEPGRSNGNVVVGRKGGLFLRLDVQGKAAHSGSAFLDGVSAIEEAACKIQALHKLTDIGSGITVNVGVMGGGQTLNTVSPDAFGELDVRFFKSEDRETLLSSVREIVGTSYVPKTSAKLQILGEFLPLEELRAGRDLFETYKAAAHSVGLDLDGEITGGCADSGFAAAQGVAVLCGTGPVGGHSHAPSEYIDISSLVPRAQAMALAIMEIDKSSSAFKPGT